MATRQLIAATAMWIGATCIATPVFSDEPKSAVDPARAEAVSRKVDELGAHLAKLDQILSHLRQMRSEEMPRLIDQLRPRTEGSVRVNKENKEQDKKEHSVQKPPADAPADATATAPALDEQLATLQQRLQQLEEISQQVATLRSEDLPKLKGELDKVTRRTTSARPLIPIAPANGRVIINNISQYTRDVNVNGIKYTIAPGAWHVPVVAYQDVITQVSTDPNSWLWGRGHWRDTADGPEMRLELR
jgi:prefoldin subunit 5